LKKIDIKAESLVGFEIFVDNLKLPKKALKDQKTKFEFSDYQKSIAISVTIQSYEKTLNDNDLENINNLIIKTVENKTGAKIRS